MSGIGLNGSLYVGLSGLQAAQASISVAGQNLTNQSNSASSRQIVVISSGTSINVAGTNLGTGVTVTGIENTRSNYLDTLVQQSNSSLGYANTVNTYMSSVQNSLSESLSSSQVDASSSQTGLEAASTDFFNAWTSLAADPTSQVAQDAVANAGLTFANTANTVENQILSVKSSVYSQASDEVTTANQLITQIADLNSQIQRAEAGTTVDAQGLTLNQATTLRDQREALVEQLSTIVNITVTNNPQNSAMVDITLTDSPTTTLVSGTVGGGGSNNLTGVQTYKLASNTYDPTGSLTISAETSGGTTVNFTPTGGDLGGLVYLDNDVIGAQTTMPPTGTPTTLLDQFNNYVYQVVTAVNGLTNTGQGSDGTAGDDFFHIGTDANGVNQVTVEDPYNITSSSYNSGAIPAAAAGAGSADATIANAIAALNTSTTSAANVSKYASVVSGIGFTTSAAQTNYTNQALLSTQVSNQRASYSGISTNEETTDLITFQQAYQASAHFISVLQQLYNSLVNMGT
ncbi:MAG: flagellar hook-associated protein FlgK [Verrucomicrobium sp.]|nr:flagellar hook-associated protein FlgK [Verrucomicrobium sp.]